MVEYSIYRTAANNLLTQAGMSDNDIFDIMSSESNLSLESKYVQCINSLIHGIRGFEKACAGLSGYNMLDGMTDDELKSKLLIDDPDLVKRMKDMFDLGLEKYLEKRVGGIVLEEQDRQELVKDYAYDICFQVASDIHDGWCIEHKFNFRDITEKHKFLPFEMIGTDDAMKLMDLGLPLLTAAGFSNLVLADELTDLYKKRSKKHRMDHLLDNLEMVVQFVKKGSKSYVGLDCIDVLPKSYRDDAVKDIVDGFYAEGAGKDVYKHDLSHQYFNIGEMKDIELFGVNMSGLKHYPVSVPVIVEQDDSHGDMQDVRVESDADVYSLRGEVLVHFNKNDETVAPSECLTPIPMYESSENIKKRILDGNAIFGIMRSESNEDVRPHEQDDMTYGY